MMTKKRSPNLLWIRSLKKLWLRSLLRRKGICLMMKMSLNYRKWLPRRFNRPQNCQKNVRTFSMVMKQLKSQANPSNHNLPRSPHRRKRKTYSTTMIKSYLYLKAKTHSQQSNLLQPKRKTYLTTMMTARLCPNRSQKPHRLRNNPSRKRICSMMMRINSSNLNPKHNKPQNQPQRKIYLMMMIMLRKLKLSLTLWYLNLSQRLSNLYQYRNQFQRIDFLMMIKARKNRKKSWFQKENNLRRKFRLHQINPRNEIFSMMTKSNKWWYPKQNLSCSQSLQYLRRKTFFKMMIKIKKT